MKKFKTKKAIMKRFKMTATGKIMRRQSNQNHFNAKESGKKTRLKRKLVQVSKPEAKFLRRLMLGAK